MLIGKKIPKSQKKILILLKECVRRKGGGNGLKKEVPYSIIHLNVLDKDVKTSLFPGTLLYLLFILC